MKTYLKYLIYFFIITFSFDLISEIETVTLKWTPTLCQESCIKGIKQRFSTLPGVTSSEIDQSTGTMRIQWKKESTFSPLMIRRAMQWIGLDIRDMRVKVRGTLSKEGKNFYMTSFGDNTRFHLISAVVAATSNQYANQYNIANRDLKPDMQLKLVDAITKKLTAVIEGPIFQPERSPPNPTQLIIDTLKLNEPEPLKKAPTANGFNNHFKNGF